MRRRWSPWTWRTCCGAEAGAAEGEAGQARWAPRAPSLGLPPAAWPRMAGAGPPPLSAGHRHCGAAINSPRTARSGRAAAGRAPRLRLPPRPQAHAGSPCLQPQPQPATPRGTRRLLARGTGGIASPHRPKLSHLFQRRCGEPSCTARPRGRLVCGGSRGGGCAGRGGQGAGNSPRPTSRRLLLAGAHVGAARGSATKWGPPTPPHTRWGAPPTHIYKVDPPHTHTHTKWTPPHTHTRDGEPPHTGGVPPTHTHTGARGRGHHRGTCESEGGALSGQPLAELPGGFGVSDLFFIFFASCCSRRMCFGPTLSPSFSRPPWAFLPVWGPVQISLGTRKHHLMFG